MWNPAITRLVDCIVAGSHPPKSSTKIELFKELWEIKDKRALTVRLKISRPGFQNGVIIAQNYLS